MKEEYSIPEMEIIQFCTQDVIKTSPEFVDPVPGEGEEDDWLS